MTDNSATKILVVDDELKLLRLVNEVLTAKGYRVLSAKAGAEAVQTIAVEQPDLVVLDIVLADDVDGYEVARRVREFSNVPIIMLTAKVGEADLLRGFEVGADDYLTKPFSAKELLARIEAVLKRSRLKDMRPADTDIVCGRVQIDPAQRRVTVNGKEVHLTKTEYDLLYELAIHRNKVMLHEQLLSAVWGPEYRDDVDYLRAYVRYLRQKLEAEPSDPQLIITNPGVGYMLVCDNED